MILPMCYPEQYFFICDNNYTDQQATVLISIVGGGSFGTQVVNVSETEY